MSFESDLIQDSSTTSTDALGLELFFAPPPQHTDAPSPEIFDQEVAELDLDFPFKFDDFSAAFYGTIPVVSTPSALTYTTDSVHGVTTSHYSSDFTQSEYSIPSEIESYYSLNNGPYGSHDSSPSAAFSNGPSSIPSIHLSKAEPDFGTSDLSPNFVGISPEDLSTAMQPTPSGTTVPIPLPVHVTPDSVAQAPAPDNDRPFKCPHPGCRHCKAKTF